MFPGGIKPGSIDPSSYSPAERTLHEAAERVASGWSARVTTSTQRFPTGSAVTLQWHEGSRQHAVAARSFKTGITELIQLPTAAAPGGVPAPRLLHRWQTLPGTDELTMALRVAMESTQHS
jgi:hypothetical protein